jgi:putative membrane protein
MKLMRAGRILCVLTMAAGMTCVAQDASGSATGSQASGSAKASGSSAKASADSKFVMKAAQGGMAEVELGNLAQSNGQSDAVKQFGKRMVDDHTKANDDLKQVAQEKNITLPTSMSAKDQATKDKLSKLQGAAFDKAYMKDMVMDHTKDVNEFKQEANSGKDSDVKAFASKYSPILQEHLSQAKQVNQEVAGASGKKSAAASSSSQSQ